MPDRIPGDKGSVSGEKNLGIDPLAGPESGIYLMAIQAVRREERKKKGVQVIEPVSDWEPGRSVDRRVPNNWF